MTLAEWLSVSRPLRCSTFTSIVSFKKSKIHYEMDCLSAQYSSHVT
jgi:hypothetical protein